MLSKKIMDKHSQIPRSGANSGFNSDYNYDDSRELPKQSLQEFSPISANYNIPEEYLNSQNISHKSQNTSEPTKDLVMNSKLPDEIKRLMLEHPIQKPQQPSVTISDDVIAAASRLMNTKANGEQVSTHTRQKTSVNINEDNTPNLKKLLKEAVREILHENGLLTENVSNSNEVFSFRVGQHIFEGRVTKIKKIK